MNGRPSHEELQELLPAAAMEVLDGPDRERVLDHVRGCKVCTQLLGEYRDVAATLPLLLPEHPFQPDRSAAIRARLLTRVREEPRAGSTAPEKTVRSAGARSSSGPGRWTGWMGWMVAAGLAGLLLVHHSVHRPVAYGWLAAGVLTFLVIALGLYVRVQQSRLAALQDQLAAKAQAAAKAPEESRPPGTGTGRRA